MTADDFGLTERVNEAILLAHRAGIVTTASLMANGRAFEPAAMLARDHPTLDCGLHLNLTEGHSVAAASEIPTLANADGFIYHHPIELWVALWTKRVRVEDIRREIRAQIAKAIAAGVAISHIDGHKHVHAVSPVLDAVISVASEHGIHAVRSVRESTPGFAALLRRRAHAMRPLLKQYLSARLLSAFFRASARKCFANGIATPVRFYGVTQTGFLDFEGLAAIVRDLPPGVSEVMCHPGYADADLAKTPTRLLSQRERELELLTNAQMRKYIESENVQLVGYKDLVSDYGGSKAHAVFHRRSAV